MRIVVDTNIVFSAILNSNGKIGRIILQSKFKLNFYSTNLLLLEIEEHKDKILSLSKYSEKELDRMVSLVTSRIRIIDYRLIPANLYYKAELLTENIDIDDTEFVALTEHSKSKLWTGDKKLLKGLKALNWNKLITTDELFDLITKSK